MKEPVPFEWWIDPESGAKFRVLTVQDDTVTVVDEFGQRRTVNRMLWDREMRRVE